MKTGMNVEFKMASGSQALIQSLPIQQNTYKDTEKNANMPLTKLELNTYFQNLGSISINCKTGKMVLKAQAMIPCAITTGNRAGFLLSLQK